MRNILSSYISVMVLLLIIALVTFVLWGKLDQGREVHSAISELEERLGQSQERNEALRRDIASFQETDTIEKEARERLNLKKEGERVAIILPSDNEENFEDEMILELYNRKQEEANRVEKQEKESSQIVKNLKAWLNLFR